MGRRSPAFLSDRDHQQKILTRELDGQPVVDVVLDAAGQKGTGKWTVISSLDLGQRKTLVAEAVYARIVSSDRRCARTAAVYSKAPSVSMR